jgi:hypothetical protein
MEDNKFLYLFFLVLIVMVTGVGFYLYSSFTKGSEEKGVIDVKKAVILTKDSVMINTDRVESYANTDSAPEARDLNIDWAKMKFSPKEKKESEPLPENPTEPVQQPKPIVAQSQPSRNVVKQSKPLPVIIDSSHSHTENNAPSNSSNKGGFGFVKSEASSNETNYSNALNESKFFLVMLEESIEIKNNTSVVFILLEDVVLDNITFSKNSYAFGKATNNNAFFDIRIEKIQNTDGRIYGVSDYSLFVFDEKYSRGFQYEGKLNESVKEGALEGAGTVQTGRIGIAQTGTQIADRIISKVTRKTEPSINLEKGYRIYIKNN